MSQRTAERVEELTHRGSAHETSSVTSSVPSYDPQASVGASYVELSLHPRPIQIVLAKEDHTFELDLEALREILLSDDVKDRKVMVLSVAGAFRKGKSFLLDYLLRYLNNGGLEGNEDWMGKDEEALTGFSWRSGSDRETTGILMWSRPFIATIPETGEEVAILLLDTQGAFDNQSTVKDSATIFALSTMISSVQVYNLSSQIQENDLQHLHLFTEYGKLAMNQDDDVKAFQSLCFLVRDWYHEKDHTFGLEGGASYLEKVLKLTENQHAELKLVREHVRSCFDNLFGFMMPHPGLVIATGDSEDGKLSDIDSKFKQQLQELAPLLLAPKNLVVKRLGDTPAIGRTLLQCFIGYMDIFQSEELPTPMTILQATAEVNNLAAQVNAFDMYNKGMDDLCGADKPYLSPEKLKDKHEEIKKTSLEEFRSKRKMGSSQISQTYEDELIRKIEEAYESFVKRNESKHILYAYRTPAVLSTIMVLSYLISTILDTLGIESLSQTAIFGLYIPLLLTLVWLYVKYSGDFREVGQFIDNVTSAIWDQVIQPIYAKVAEQALKRAVKMATKTKKD